MWLDATTKKLELVLEQVVTLFDPLFVVAYADWDATTYTPGVALGASNGSTTVDLLAAPASGFQRRVNSITIENRDTDTHTITVKMDVSGTEYIIIRCPLLANESLCYNEAKGWHVTVAQASGRYLRTVFLQADPGIDTGIAGVQVSGYYIPGAGCNNIFLRLQGGGGGGGGGSRAANAPGFAAGGSAGGYLEKYVAVSPNTLYQYQVGCGGAGASAGFNTGVTAGATSIEIGGTTYTANGGLGGAGMATGATIVGVLGGASPAVSTNGDLNAGGEPGGMGFRNGTTTGTGGYGGSCRFGAGGGSQTTDAAGNAATSSGYGGGGGGGAAIAANRGGGNGADGCILIDEYT